TNAHASELAHALHARAFTIGHDIVFGIGQYTPETIAGQRLLAHELTHVIQQGAGGQPSQDHVAGKDPSDHAALEAAHASSPVIEERPGPMTSREVPHIARQELPAGVPPSEAEAVSTNQPGGPFLDLQLACMTRLGGCVSPGGILTPQQIADYDQQ